MNAASLQAALEARGLRCRVHGHDRMAVVTPDDEEALAVVLRVRDEVVREGRARGFTHVAVELCGVPEDASLPGD